MTTMDNEYTPTPAEQQIAAHIDGVIGELLSGELDGIGICGVRKDGDPIFFYLNKVEGPVLRPAINRLLGLYESGRQFGELTNAPRTNRSYLVH